MHCFCFLIFYIFELEWNKMNQGSELDVLHVMLMLCFKHFERLFFGLYLNAVQVFDKMQKLKNNEDASSFR